LKPRILSGSSQHPDWPLCLSRMIYHIRSGDRREVEMGIQYSRCSAPPWQSVTTMNTIFRVLAANLVGANPGIIYQTSVALSHFGPSVPIKHLRGRFGSPAHSPSPGGQSEEGGTQGSIAYLHARMPLPQDPVTIVPGLCRLT
jgi:hypothetical protein